MGQRRGHNNGKRPQTKRGLLSGFLQSGFSFGFLLAAIAFDITTMMFPGQTFEQVGWRVLFFTGIVPGFVALFVRLSMSESPLWDAKNKSGSLERSPLRTIVLGKKYRKEFFLCAAIMTGLVYMYHGSISILPTYLQQFGQFDKGDVAKIMICATASSWVGMIITGWISQKTGRRKAILFFVIASVIVSVPLADAILYKSSLVFTYITIFAFVVSTASGPIPAFFLRDSQHR